MENTPSVTIMRRRAPAARAAAQVGQVGVAVAVAGGLAQAHPVDDGGVVELLGDDGVLGSQ